MKIKKPLLPPFKYKKHLVSYQQLKTLKYIAPQTAEAVCIWLRTHSWDQVAPPMQPSCRTRSIEREGKARGRC